MKVSVLIATLAVVGLSACGSAVGETGQVAQPVSVALAAQCKIVEYPQPNLKALNAQDNSWGTSEYETSDLAPGLPPIYTVTLTNDTSGPVTVSEITSAFFAGVAELTSDSEAISGTIASGYSLSWNFALPEQITSYVEDVNGNPAVYSTSATSCHVETWN